MFIFSLSFNSFDSTYAENKLNDLSKLLLKVPVLDSAYYFNYMFGLRLRQIEQQRGSIENLPKPCYGP